jgi:hypothetical protein
MEEVNSNARWAVFCSAFSFATAGVVTLMHMSSSLSHYIIGTKIEGFLTLVLVAFWSGTVAVGAFQPRFWILVWSPWLFVLFGE